MDNTLSRTRELHEAADNIHIPSMLLDVQKQRPFEVEAIVGEVVRMAQARKVEIPVSVGLGNDGCVSKVCSAVQRIEVLYSLLLVIQNQMLAGRKQ